MGLLGTLWDKQSLKSLVGSSTTTFNHSVGAAPDLVLANLRSMANCSVGGHLFVEGANASLATVGLQQPSAGAAAAPAIAFDLFVIQVWSPAR